MTSAELEHAKAIAVALSAKGIANDPPEETPNPFLAAREAFFVCCGYRDTKAWRALRALLCDNSRPGIAYYRKLSEICLRALRRPGMPGELIEPVAYARGYFDASVKFVLEGQSADLRSSE